MDMEIILGDLDNPQVLDLLKRHLEGMHESSPPEHVHALGISALKKPEISFWTLQKAGLVMGCGALKFLGDSHGEIKSMHTHSDYLRQGVAAKILDHIISEARHRNYSHLSLETGTTSEFMPALNLYSKYGFKMGAPFGDYTDNAFSQFMHLNLGAA